MGVTCDSYRTCNPWFFLIQQRNEAPRFRHSTARRSRNQRQLPFLNSDLPLLSPLVPEGRHIVAHYVSGGKHDGSEKSPVGTAHSLDETECVVPTGLDSPPYGSPPFHGGLRSAVPPGLRVRPRRDRSNAKFVAPRKESVDYKYRARFFHLPPEIARNAAICFAQSTRRFSLYHLPS